MYKNYWFVVKKDENDFDDYENLQIQRIDNWDFKINVIQTHISNEGKKKVFLFDQNINCIVVLCDSR